MIFLLWTIFLTLLILENWDVIKALIECIIFFCIVIFFLFSYRFELTVRVASHVSDGSLFLYPCLTFALRFPPAVQKTRRISVDTDILTLYCVHCTIFSGCDVEVWKTECLATEDHPCEIFNTHELGVCGEHSNMKRWLVRTYFI